ncbi:MAG: Smr/MutS family protein, partial [Burkholderiales bacterium]|nr:Smr/MutS family protein [Burkholderiales bacterium]
NEPVLKQLVKSWLMQREDVLAFVQARPAEGGSGAVVVMLKRGK